MIVRGIRAAALLALAAFPLAAQAPASLPDTSLYRTLQWRNIGPFRGGRSVAVAGVRSQPNTFYAGYTGGGLWKTEDRGETWRNVSDRFFKTGSVGAIAVAPSDPNVIYAGMGEHAIRGVATHHGDGVYRSTDAGTTWTHAGLEKTRQISRIRVHPSNPDLVYVAAQGAIYAPTSDRGIYRSRDGGKTWDRVHFVSDSSGASDLAIDPTNPRILYAAYWDHQRTPWQVRSGGTGSGIYKSTDGGDTWTKQGGEDGGKLPKLMGKIGVDVSPVDPNVVWAIVEAEDGGLYRSEDAGKTWRRTSEDRLIRARAWYYTEVYADPRDRETVYVLNAPLTRSIDGGRTFQEIPVPHGDTHDLWIDPADSRVMILADDGGATITLNGGRTWSTQENQPTSQFYRVNTDNRFPYWVYGGQQDNSSVAIMSRNPAGFGIGWKNWFEAAGCESAYLAFNPDDPRYLYGGCYQGSISEMDTRTGYQRDIMAYPSQNLAIDPKSQKYRFNWNAPLIVSKHDPSVIYHASNVLLRSSDRGNTWTEVSPDLTRNEKAKQGAGGTPITNEGAGGEIYNTIFYVAESPVQAGVLWAGSDDGLIHLTRDGGKTWENMTPRGHSEARVNAIEASPHDAGTAYVAIALDKLNDYTPLAFRTRDWGKTWVRISNGIAPEAWVRVVREDPVRKGLLYAGTETGVYVSWDDGDRWQPLQLNLPAVPVTDLKIQGNDLVASTSGRSFWILDDITLLRRVGAGLIPPLQVVAPEKVYRLPAPGFILEVPRIGPNPPGAVFHVWLRAAPDTAKAVKVEVLDAAGAVIRTMTTRREKGGDGKLLPADSIALKQGMNRVSWNVRHQGYESIPGLFSLGAAGAGRMVLPGRYTVRVTTGTDQATAALEVIPDPRHEYPASAFAEQDVMAKTLQGHLADLYSYVRKLRAAKEQLAQAGKRSEGRQDGSEVKTAADSLAKKFTDAEERLVQPRAKTFQDVINYQNQLDAQLLTLFGAVDGAEPPLTAGQRQRLRDLEAQWAQEKAALDRALGAEIEAFNRLVREKGVPAVVP